MGLSIHYSGFLKEPKLLPELIDEIKNVAEVYNWKHNTYETQLPDNKFSKEKDFEKIFGISFTPSNCETISLTFLSDGAMICPARVKFTTDFSDDKQSWFYTNSVKTQYAGVKIHQLIIHLFRHLDNEYFRDFKMIDESDYWETNDEKRMIENFKAYDRLIDNFMLATETFPLHKNEEITDYFKRLMHHIKNLEK